ncbi:hypothetical protein EfmJHP36_02660 [Enterococcus faecium]|nr:hypothetical protein EfmJHP36_02660 [Enterococcus faecium]
MTLCQLYAKQNAQRPKVRKNTETGRKYLMDILKKDKLGVRSIDSIKPSDAKEWAIRMSENGYAYHLYHVILKYPENICMLCIPMVMHKNPSDKSIYHWDFYALLGF